MNVTAEILVTLKVSGTVVQVAPNSIFVRALHDAMVGDIHLGMFSHEIQLIAMEELEHEGRKLLEAGKDILAF